MKNSSIAILICALFFIPMQGNAQAATLALIFGDKVASENFNLSLEFGVNSSGISNFKESQRGKEINFGGACNIKLSEKFYLSPTVFFMSGRKIELSKYSLNSGNNSLDQLFTDKKGEINLNYIDINLPLFYQMNKFRIGIAPQVSFLKNSHLQLDNYLGSFTHNIKPEVNNIDYGLLSILSYELGTARKGKGIFIQFRYYQGFCDVFKIPASPVNRTNFFSIHLSLPFITDELAQKKLQSNRKN